MAVKEFAVDDDPDAQPPAGIDVEERLLGVTFVVHILAVGRGAGVVLDENRVAEPLLEEHRQGLFLDEKVAVTIPRPGIHPPGDIHADGEYLRRIDLVPLDKAENDVAEVVERLRTLQVELHHLAVNQVALEIHGAHDHGILLDVGADNQPRVGIQPVDIGFPASGGLLFAEIVNELLFDQFAEQLGDRRNAQVDSFTQVCDARIAFKNEMPDNVLFENCILISFGCEFEKRLFHDAIFCVNIIKIYQSKISAD